MIHDGLYDGYAYSMLLKEKYVKLRCLLKREQYVVFLPHTEIHMGVQEKCKVWPRTFVTSLKIYRHIVISHFG